MIAVGLDPYFMTIQPEGNVQFSVTSLTAGAGLAAPIPLNRIVHVAGTLMMPLA